MYYCWYVPLYVCDCTSVVYMFCVYCIYYYVNKFEARSLFSTSHLNSINLKNRHLWCTTRISFGSTFFLDLQNDLPNVSDKLFSILFADDTSVFIESRNIDEVIGILNTELQS